ncbi:MAG: fumarylacetoacetate hydrolase family protein [Planctomycetota bacterium]
MELIRGSNGVSVVLPHGGLLPLTYIVGIGRNYADHAAERGAAVPERPLVFTKSPSALCLDGDEIVIPEACLDEATGGRQTDYEAELAVIIGRNAKDVAEDDALGYVAGYACANDVSARWWQKDGAGGQFCRGKSFDTFCPIGPRVVSAELLPDASDLRITCRINGEVMQDASTAEMIFSVPELIAELSRGATLPAGTVILTGTPAGVGAARTPPRWLAEGDEVEVEIESVGLLRNRVRETAAAAVGEEVCVG